MPASRRSRVYGPCQISRITSLRLLRSTKSSLSLWAAQPNRKGDGRGRAAAAAVNDDKFECKFVCVSAANFLSYILLRTCERVSLTTASSTETQQLQLT